MLSVVNPEVLRDIEIKYYHKVLKDEYRYRKIIMDLLDIEESTQYFQDIMGENINVQLLYIPDTFEKFVEAMPNYDDLETSFDFVKISDDCLFRTYFRSPEKGKWMRKTVDLLRYKKYIRKDLKRLYSDLQQQKESLDKTILDTSSLHNRIDTLYIALCIDGNICVPPNIYTELDVANRDLNIITENIMNSMENILNTHSNIQDIKC